MTEIWVIWNIRVNFSSYSYSHSERIEVLAKLDKLFCFWLLFPFSNTFFCCHSSSKAVQNPYSTIWWLFIKVFSVPRSLLISSQRFLIKIRLPSKLEFANFQTVYIISALGPAACFFREFDGVSRVKMF